MPGVMDRWTLEKTLLLLRRLQISECKAGARELSVAALLEHGVGCSLGNSNTLII